MTWVKRLRRVFKIDIDPCSECGGSVTVIACIEDPVAIKRSLALRTRIGLKWRYGTGKFSHR